MDQSRHDAWAEGSAYDLYMGRWSRRMAPLFLDWLAAPQNARWLDIGCGAGALSATILGRCAPLSVHGVDPSEGFVDQARASAPGASFSVGDAQALERPDAFADVTVSALMLNFVPAKHRALKEFARVTRPGGVAAFYVWDYPGGGAEFVHAFWTAAAALDPAAGDLAEDRRFAFCAQQPLVELATESGWRNVESTALEAPCVFAHFEDFWRPFTLGAGPAPGYCASLAPEARERLRQRLDQTLPRAADGSIEMKLRAWAVKSRV